MDYVLLALEHHAIVADSKTICLKASKWFGEFERVRLGSVQMYLLIMWSRISHSSDLSCRIAVSV